MKAIHIDRNRRLRDDPGTGHNRWHPDIEPILELAPGEDLLLETRDAADGQVKPGMTFEDLSRNDKKAGHPLTGPIFVKGAKPGDILEVEFVDLTPQPYGLDGHTSGCRLFARDLRRSFSGALGGR